MKTHEKDAERANLLRIGKIAIFGLLTNIGDMKKNLKEHSRNIGYETPAMKNAVKAMEELDNELFERYKFISLNLKGELNAEEKKGVDA